MENVAVELIEDDLTESPPPKRKRGRPDGSKTTKVPRAPATVGSTRYKNYYTGHHNKAQDTQAAWAWIDGLDDAEKALLDLTVYRDWPVLKLPLAPPDGATKRKNPKSIAEQTPGTEAFKTDQDLVHMFGAGNYRVYVNENPPDGARRELFCCVVKATHDFRAFPPTDWRIDNINEVDLSDPSNGSYVAWLKSQGKVPDDAKAEKEKEEMSATAEVLGKVLDQNTAVMNRILDEKDKQIAESDSALPPEPPPSPQEVISEQLSIFKSLKELVPTSDPLEMVKQVIGMAQVLTQKDGNANADLKPLMDEISKLREESRATEREFFRTQLSDIKEQLRAAKETPPQSNVVLPDGSNLESVIQKIVDRVVDKPEDNPWLDIAKQAVPVVLPLLTGLAQQFLRPQQQPSPSPFPQPPPNYQAGAVAQPQAQLPAPAPPQPQPVAQPQAGGAFTTGNPQLDMLLMAITVPLADMLRDGDSGNEFAEYFITEFGFDVHAQLASSGADAIIGVLYSYPPLASTLKPLARERVVKFVSEFVAFKPQTEPTGSAA